MEFEALVASIDSGRLAPAYLLHGPERFAQRAVVAALRRRLVQPGWEALSLVQLDVEAATAATVAAEAGAAGLAGGRLVVVDGGLPGDPDGPLLDYLARPAPGAALVFRCPEPADRRRRLVRRLGEVGVVLATPHPADAELVPWLRRRADALGLALERAAAERLAARVPPVLDLLDQEMHKLATYVGPGAVIGVEAVETLVARSREQRIFDLLDAVAERRSGRAFELAATLRGQGEETLGVLALLARQYRLAAQAAEASAEGLRGEEITRRLGAHPFVVRKAVAQARRLGERDLEVAFTAIWQAERSIKSGSLPESLALDLLIARLCSGRRTA